MKIDYGQKWGIDSNLFVYFINSDSHFHKSTLAFFETLVEHHVQLYTSVNNLIETHRVLTSLYKTPKVIALDKIVDTISALNIQTISSLPTTMKTYYQICQTSPKNDLFDLFFAATFIDNNVHHLFTNNTKDFQDLEKYLTVHSPF
jgi:predicted nucleic acid-binding protein